MADNKVQVGAFYQELDESTQLVRGGHHLNGGITDQGAGGSLPFADGLNVRQQSAGPLVFNAAFNPDISGNSVANPVYCVDVYLNGVCIQNLSTSAGNINFDCTKSGQYIVQAYLDTQDATNIAQGFTDPRVYETRFTIDPAGIQPKLHIIEVPITSDGTQTKLSATVKFSDYGLPAFAIAPEVAILNITASVSYIDVTDHPYITNVSTGAFVVNINIANPANKFGAGTAKIKFAVIEN